MCVCVLHPPHPATPPTRQDKEHASPSGTHVIITLPLLFVVTVGHVCAQAASVSVSIVYLMRRTAALRCADATEFVSVTVGSLHRRHAG